MEQKRSQQPELPLFVRPTSEFEEYGKQNPEIWQEFEKIALQLIFKGVKRYGAKAIFEIIRYHRFLENRGDKFKVNNNYTAGYARKFVEKYPQYKDFFEMRRRRA